MLKVSKGLLNGGPKDGFKYMYPGFFLCRGTYDSAPVNHQTRNVRYVLFFTYLVESFALILATKSRF